MPGGRETEAAQKKQLGIGLQREGLTAGKPIIRAAGIGEAEGAVPLPYDRGLNERVARGIGDDVADARLGVLQPENFRAGLGRKELGSDVEQQYG